MKILIMIAIVFQIFPSHVYAARNAQVSNQDGIALIDSPVGNGSGVLIAPDLVLTVAHVTSDIPHAVRVYFMFSPETHNVEHKVAQIIQLSTDFRQELTLLRLKEPVKNKAWSIAQNVLQPNTLVDGVGYGIVGAEAQLSQKTAKMIFKAEIDMDIPLFSTFVTIRPGARLDPHVPMFQLEPGPKNSFSCSGDSGGPILYKDRVIGLTDLVTVGPHEADVERTEVEFCNEGKVLYVIPLYRHLNWLIDRAKELGSTLKVESF